MKSEEIEEIDPGNVIKKLSESSERFDFNEQFDEFGKLIIELAASVKQKRDFFICIILEAMERKHYQRVLNREKNDDFIFHPLLNELDFSIVKSLYMSIFLCFTFNR